MPTVSSGDDSFAQSTTATTFVLVDPRALRDPLVYSTTCCPGSSVPPARAPSRVPSVFHTSRGCVPQFHQHASTPVGADGGAFDQRRASDAVENALGDLHERRRGRVSPLTRPRASVHVRRWGHRDLCADRGHTASRGCPAHRRVDQWCRLFATHPRHPSTTPVTRATSRAASSLIPSPKMV